MAKKSTKRSKKPDEITRPDNGVEGTNPPAPAVEASPTPPHDGAGEGTGRAANVGLTSLTDYYQEPEPEPTITPEERAAIRDQALTATFGVPVPDFRSAVVARLNDKLRS